MLDYLLSPGGRLGKTAGCYSLLAADMPRVATSSSSSSSPLSTDTEQMEFWDTTPGRVARQALTRVCRREEGQRREVHMLDGGRREEEKRETDGDIKKKPDNSDKMKRLRKVEEKENRPVGGELRPQVPGGASNWRRSVAMAPRK